MNVHFFKINLPLLLICLFSSFVALADCRDQTALYARAQNLFKSGQYLLSSVHFSELSANTCSTQLASHSLFAYSLSMAELNESSEVFRTLYSLEQNKFISPALHEKSLLFHAFLVPDFNASISEYSRLRLEIWKAKNQAEQFSKLSASPFLSNGMRTELNSINEELSNLPRKNPLIAGFASSLIPGAGQAYVGAFQSAAIALILNSLFLATTVELANHKLPYAALASGMIFSVTYIGNILNAADSANQKNSNMRVSQEHRLRETLFPEFSP